MRAGEILFLTSEVYSSVRKGHKRNPELANGDYLKYKSPKLIELNPEFYPEESPEDQSRNRKIKIKRFVKAANINTNTIKPPKK